MRDIPVEPPKSGLITGFLGLIHVTKAKTLRNFATMDKISKLLTELVIPEVAPQTVKEY